MRAARYDTATEACQRARARIGELLEKADEELQQAGGPAETQLADIQRELTDQHTYSRALLSLVNFLSEMRSGNYSVAVQYAGDAVALGDAWAKTRAGHGGPGVYLGAVPVAVATGWLQVLRTE